MTLFIIVLASFIWQFWPRFGSLTSFWQFDIVLGVWHRFGSLTSFWQFDIVFVVWHRFCSLTSSLCSFDIVFESSTLFSTVWLMTSICGSFAIFSGWFCHHFWQLWLMTSYLSVYTSFLGILPLILTLKFLAGLTSCLFVAVLELLLAVFDIVFIFANVEFFLSVLMSFVGEIRVTWVLLRFIIEYFLGLQFLSSLRNCQYNHHWFLVYTVLWNYFYDKNTKILPKLIAAKNWGERDENVDVN